MMILTPPFVIALLAIHWFGDFFLQSDWMALNKSKNWLALSVHVSIYTTTLFVLMSIVTGHFALVYALVNGVLHFGTDAITSRITASLYKQKKNHWFFVVVGIDQLIHYTTLILTLSLLVT